MRKINWLFFTLFAFTVFACNDDESLDEVDPTINITSPQNGDDFTVGESVTLTGTISDNVVVEEVRILITGATNFDELSFQVNTQTYELNQTFELEENWAAGNYDIRITAEDSEGNTATETLNITVLEGTGEDPGEGGITVTGIEEGGAYNFVGSRTGAPVTYTIADEEGVEEVDVMVVAQDGTVLSRRRYSQEYFDEVGITDLSDFSIEDELMWPNVAAATGEQTFTITTRRGDNDVDSQSFNITSDVAEGAREVEFNITVPESTPEDAEVVIVGDFQPAPFTPNDPLYAFSDEDEDGVYTGSLYVTDDIEYKYALMAEEDASDFWMYVEKGEECEEIENRTLTFEAGEETLTVDDEVANWRTLDCAD